MTISFNNQIAGSQAESVLKMPNSVPLSSKPQIASSDDTCDTLDISDKKEKTSAWQKFKNGYTSVTKGLITVGEYAKGTVKGIVDGSVAALCVLGADALHGLVKKSPKPVSTKGKVAAGVAGAAVFALDLLNANLCANAKKADVDHRWRTGHNKD